MATMNPEEINHIAQNLKQSSGIAKAVTFIASATTGLTPVEQFAICEGEAKLKEDPVQGTIVIWSKDV